MLADESAGKKKLKKKKDKKKKNKGAGEGIDEGLWSKMEIKIEEIVRNADLNTLTNRQVKKQLMEHFPGVNIKAYKTRIKEKINAVAEQAQNENE